MSQKQTGCPQIENFASVRDATVLFRKAVNVKVGLHGMGRANISLLESTSLWTRGCFGMPGKQKHMS